MLKFIFNILILFEIGIITGCSFHLRDTTTMTTPIKMKTLIIQSNDPYGLLACAVRHQLHLNNVVIVNENNKKLNSNYPVLILSKEIQHNDFIPFIRNNILELTLSIKVNAHFLLPNRNKSIYPMSITEYRTILNNVNYPLAMYAAKEMLLKEMRQDIAEQLVRKLLIIWIVRYHPG